MTKWYVLIIAVVLIVVAFNVFAATKTGTYILATISMKAPIFGTLTVKTAAANFARTLSTLTASGISMIEALEIAGNTMKNVIFKDAVLEAKDKVAQGRPLSEPLKVGKVFPNMIVHMIGIGEETGNMEEMLVTAASYYEEEVEVTTQSVTALIEPLIIVVMAAIVGVIIMAILISAVWKFVKKVAGTGVAIALSVVLLVSGGVLTLGQVRNFMEASGIVVKEGWATATEDGGSAFIYWIQDLIDDEDSDVGGFDFTPNEGFFDE
jgi:hypothetical protein